MSQVWVTDHNNSWLYKDDSNFLLKTSLGLYKQILNKIWKVEWKPLRHCAWITVNEQIFTQEQLSQKKPKQFLFPG